MSHHLPKIQFLHCYLPVCFCDACLVILLSPAMKIILLNCGTVKKHSTCSDDDDIRVLMYKFGELKLQVLQEL